MAVANAYGVWIPEPFGLNGATAPGFSTAGTLMDAAGEKAGAVLMAPKTGSIRKIHVRIGTAATPTDSDFRLETVDTSTGNPTGTLFGANTNVTVASASITASTWVASGALTEDASVTKGDVLAIVVVPTGSPNFTLSYLNQVVQVTNGHVYTVGFAAAAWTKTGTVPVCALEYSDGSFAYTPFIAPAASFTTHTFNSGSTPDEHALKITLNAPVRVTGLWAAVDNDNAYDLVLYDSDGSTVLGTLTMGVNIDQGKGFPLLRAGLFTSSIQLSAGVAYYVSVKPGASNVSAYSLVVNSAAILDQMSMGQNAHYASRVDAGAWSATTTQRLLAGLIIDGIDDGVSVGGGAAQFRMGSVG